MKNRLARFAMTDEFTVRKRVKLALAILIIPTLDHYAYFAQFGWLEKTFYTLINFMSRDLRTILPLAPKMYNNVDKNMILMTKLEL